MNFVIVCPTFCQVSFAWKGLFPNNCSRFEYTCITGVICFKIISAGNSEKNNLSRFVCNGLVPYQSQTIMCYIVFCAITFYKTSIRACDQVLAIATLYLECLGQLFQ